MRLRQKVNPVPFGEYVPDRWFYELIVPDLVGLIQREYTPGSNPPLVQVGDVGVGLAICFDVIYDAVIWDGARAGAEVFVFQTNNADFRGTDENLQQLAFARMRAKQVRPPDSPMLWGDSLSRFRAPKAVALLQAGRQELAGPAIKPDLSVLQNRVHRPDEKAHRQWSAGLCRARQILASNAPTGCRNSACSDQRALRRPKRRCLC